MRVATRTGQFRIGFRRGWSAWQKDIASVISFAKANGFAAIDVESAEAAGAVVSAGLAAGTVDAPDWKGLISADAGHRADAVAKVAAAARACRGKTRNFFIVMLPEDPKRPRKENFGYMMDSCGRLVDVLRETGVRLSVEGYPGEGALCCTPEGYRAFLKELPADVAGINYDPSHLLRMGIDPIRFLAEFASRVVHVHGKDTELMPERLYEFGHEQPPTFAKGFEFGSACWRYTIPGHGQVRWIEAFRILKQANYDGCVCVELEDENFNGAEEGEKAGLFLARQYLEGV
jgi:sugar phosphate isomerase/epimerase